jgi:hypothetical protein
MAKAVEGVEAFVSTLPGDERKKMEVNGDGHCTERHHWVGTMMTYPI